MYKIFTLYERERCTRYLFRKGGDAEKGVGTPRDGGCQC